MNDLYMSKKKSLLRPATLGSSQLNRFSGVKLLRFDVIQHDDPLVMVTQKNKVYMEITSAALDGDNSLLISWIYGRNTIDAIKEILYNEKILESHVLYSDRDSGWIYLVKKSSGILKTIFGAHGILASSIKISGGKKVFTVLIPAKNIGLLRKSSKKNLESKGYKVKITNITGILREDPAYARGIHLPFSIVRKDINSQLTSKEKRILLDLVMDGFYDWPRKNSLGELAGRYGISKSTLAYHVRNAEKKIITTLINRYKLIRAP